MNEERDREDTPPSSRRDEFARMRGEIQHPGSRVLAVPPPSPPAPIGIAPPDPRNVVSNFDTRPIGAYDFAFTGTLSWTNGEVAPPSKQFSVDVPDGFTAALRRVRFEWVPSGMVNVGSALIRVVHIDLLRASGVIPNNRVDFYGMLTTYEWPTHQVFGYWETMGVQVNPEFGFGIPLADGDTINVAVTFMGVLIPTKSRPPEVEIASDPVVVRDYETLSKEPPDTGAAGS